MSKQENKRMGSDPLAWINQEPEKQDQEPLNIPPQKKTGRPRTIYREYEKSSQENLPDKWTRATFIVHEDRLKKLKDFAYTERKTLKEVVNEMIDDYLKDKDIIEREDK